MLPYPADDLNRGSLTREAFSAASISSIISDPTNIDSLSLPAGEKTAAINAYGMSLSGRLR